jgi:hypothetical protein
MGRPRLYSNLRACRPCASPYRRPTPDDTPKRTPDALAKMSDQELITVSKTIWDDGDTAMDALAAEAERRGLDF